MIQGRFVKNGECTEIHLGNGLTELIPAESAKRELQVFTLAPRRKTPHRKIEELSLGNVIALGIAIGGTVGGFWIAILSLQGFPLTQMILAAVLAYDALFLLQNLLKEKQ